MSDQDFRELIEWDWLIFARGSLLHMSIDIIRDEAAGGVGGDGTTLCGKRGSLWIPGFLTRMSAKRCPRCCKALGYPQGRQSPKNDPACRPLVEARLKAARASYRVGRRAKTRA